MAEINRREFVVATAACACTCLLTCESSEAQPAANANATLDVGQAADFPAGKVSGKFARSDKVLIAHVDDHIYAMSAVCTHRRSTCLVNPSDGKIRCPSHGSTFSEQGTPTGGPAKTALFRYGIKLDDKGHLIVDKSKSFGEKDWENPDSFVKVS